MLGQWAIWDPSGTMVRNPILFWMFWDGWQLWIHTCQCHTQAYSSYEILSFSNYVNERSLPTIELLQYNLAMICNICLNIKPMLPCFPFISYPCHLHAQAHLCSEDISLVISSLVYASSITVHVCPPSPLPSLSPSKSLSACLVPKTLHARA